MVADWSAINRQVKEASDIVDVIGSYLGVHPAGVIFKALCPFHNDTRPSLQIDPKWQNYRCWACGKKGDVFSFVMEMDKVDFREARETLARRAGIELVADAGPNPARLKLLDAIRWADGAYRQCLLESSEAEQARLYLGERKLVGESVRGFGLGFAPMTGEWLVRESERAGVSWETLLEVGLLGERKERQGFYDRFRDRVMFPIRDMRGQTVGFGGRILPASPFATRNPKYYNTSETPLFKKDELLFGLDMARSAAAERGVLVVMEGYMDVIMSHQYGIPHTVATMGTALNASHVRQLRRYVPKVVLLFDADAGGSTGVDRALEIFVGQDVELAIATLPEGLDPCDLLTQQGPEPLLKAIATAQDALDFKLNQLLEREADHGVRGTERIVDAILTIMAMAPELPGQAGRVKQELICTRISHRLGLRLETVWARFGEIRKGRQHSAPVNRMVRLPSQEPPPEYRPNLMPALERQLLTLLFGDPMLVPIAASEVEPDDITHPALRKLLTGLVRLQALSQTPDIDGLRTLMPDSGLIGLAMDLLDVGRTVSERDVWLRRVLDSFKAKRSQAGKEVIRDQLSGTADHASALDLLRKIQASAGNQP